MPNNEIGGRPDARGSSPTFSSARGGTSGKGRREERPFAEHLHFIPRVIIRYPQAVLVRVFRKYIERAPGWVLLTTKGRKTGLPREVLLPCDRFDNCVLVISTYGRRSDWIRNIQREPQVQVTAAGHNTEGRAEIVESVVKRQALLSAHPYLRAVPGTCAQCPASHGVTPGVGSVSTVVGSAASSRADPLRQVDGKCHNDWSLCRLRAGHRRKRDRAYCSCAVDALVCR